MKQEKKFKLATLGCRTNQYETAAYATQLKEMGYVEAAENETADLCIINTCTVTEGADKSSRHQIRHLAQKNPEAKIVVTGCLADRLPAEIQAIEGVDLVLPNKEKENLMHMLFPDEENLPEFAIDHFGGHTRAFVKVQDGCNSFCTYCIIPYVRGRSRSRSVDSIVREVEKLIANGYKEVVITGINVGDFDGGGEVTLAELVRLIDQTPGLHRLRISSIDPDEVNDELLAAVTLGKTTCQSMHIVLQSGSNAVLKKMNRKYTKQIFLDTVAKLKGASPDFTFTTDVIVGFPGETDADFEETLDLMHEVKFAKVHMFPYSKRDRTRAALYPNQVAPDIIQKRKQEVLRLSEQLAFDLRQSYVGKTLAILLEDRSTSHPSYFTGHTDNFLPVLVPAANLQSNTLVEVTCTENTPEGLIGCVLP